MFPGIAHRGGSLDAAAAGWTQQAEWLRRAGVHLNTPSLVARAEGQHWVEIVREMDVPPFYEIPASPIAEVVREIIAVQKLEAAWKLLPL